MDAKDLPYDIKKKLVDISKKELATDEERKSFCQKAGKRIAETAQSFFSDYQNTIVYGVIGSVLGFVAAQGVRAIPWVGPVLGPLADIAAVIFAGGCTLEGYRKDCDNAQAKRDEERLLKGIRDIIADELEKAKLSPNA